VKAPAARLTQLRVPVEVDVDLDTFRTDAERGEPSDFVALSHELVDDAILVTPLPRDGLEPLQRRESAARAGR
jgi:hypothetical protein